MEEELNKETEPNNSTLEEPEKKKKKKLVLAKNRQEAVLAIVIMGLFIANTIYMIVEYIIKTR